MSWQHTLPERGFFSREQKAQLATLFRQIVPSSAERGIPGAEEAKAVDFVDYLLNSAPEVFDEIPVWRANYPKWLSAINTAAKPTFGYGLIDLNDTDATRLLQMLEAGKLDEMAKEFDQKLIFTTIWRHCLQGCFSDPRWGGNNDRVMWRWYGYLQSPERAYFGLQIKNG